MSADLSPVGDVDALVEDASGWLISNGPRTPEDADLISSLVNALAALKARVERLKTNLSAMCDEFEDATYDRIDGSQSQHRKNMILRGRAAMEDRT